ncbi:MAG TPA: hypothetical protein VHA52_10015 [Candidatus Babeliaceae bacterium]|nr:hypothetical protein [Candidatus Babeliaceae bacterium]
MKDFIKTNDLKEILEIAGENLIRPDAYHVLIKVFCPEEKTEAGLMLTEKTREDAISICVVGLVLKKGPAAYQKIDKQGNKYFDDWDKCEVGDWIIFREASGPLLKMSKLPVRLIPDDAILAHINDPSTVTRD